MKSFNIFLTEKAEKVSGQGTQQSVGAVTETIAAAALIHHHLHPKHFNKPENQETLKRAKSVYDTAAPRLDKEDLQNRTNHGFAQAERIKQHMQDMYPDHEITEVHHTNIEGAIERATKGKHKDSALVNPSDVTVGLRHKKTGQMVYHGISLKSTQKTKGDIGFKNPSPKHMDAALGTRTTQLWQQAHDDLHKHVNKLHPGFSSLTNNEKKEALRKLSGNRVNRDRNEEISADPAHEKFHQQYEKIKAQTHARIRNHIVDHLQGMINSGEDGHRKVKDFLLNNYLNAGGKDDEPSDTPPMPYSKVTTNGTAKSGITSKVEVPHESKVANLLRDPETRLEVSKAPTGDKYIHYHAHVPQKDAKGNITGFKRVHLFSEQVKTSSAFGNSSPRHNIQPPGKEGLNEEIELDEVSADDLLAVAKKVSPNAKLSTPETRQKDKEAYQKRTAKYAGKPNTTSAYLNKPQSYPLGGYDRKSNRSYSEEVKIKEDFGIMRALSPMLHPDSYGKAKTALKALLKRKTDKRHDKLYYAAQIARSYPDVDARKLADMTEEVVANNVGGGQIAGLGIGDQGEPGVNKKNKKKVMPFSMFKRKAP